MMKIICVSAVVTLIAGCAARHAPRVSCSARLEEINLPQPASTLQPAASAPEAPAP